jgi:hypothetical protein
VSAESRQEAERDAELEQEGRIFAEYLVGRPPPLELVQRYVQAHRALGAKAAAASEGGLTDFVRRHPWSVGFLDAAAALLEPGGLLRGKILMMSAILETSPAFADEFLPRAVGAPALFLRLAGLGVTTTLRALVGLVLYAVAVRSPA